MDYADNTLNAKTVQKRKTIKKKPENELIVFSDGRKRAFRLTFYHQINNYACCSTLFKMFCEYQITHPILRFCCYCISVQTKIWWWLPKMERKRKRRREENAFYSKKNTQHSTITPFFGFIPPALSQIVIKKSDFQETNFDSHFDITRTLTTNFATILYYTNPSMNDQTVRFRYIFRSKYNFRTILGFV